MSIYLVLCTTLITCFLVGYNSSLVESHLLFLFILNNQTLNISNSTTIVKLVNLFEMTYI